jgi:hypothetical protein
MKKITSIILSFLIFQDLYVSENGIKKNIAAKTISQLKKGNRTSILDQNIDLSSENNIKASKNFLSIQQDENDVFKSNQFISTQSKVLLKTPSLGATSKEIKDALYEKIKASSHTIDESLFFKAGKSRVLFGKNIAVIIDHIVNIVPEVGSSGEITLQGGHTYKTIASFKNQGGLLKDVFYKDPKTNCWLIDGVDNFTGKRFYKTIFPQGWTPEDVYAAIVTGTLLDNQESEIVKGRQVMRVKICYKNNPEFIARLVLYKRQKSDTWEIMTAFPEFQ